MTSALVLCMATALWAVSPEKFDGSFEFLASGDVKLSTGFVTGSIELRPATGLDVQLEISRKDVGYAPNAPIDPLGMETSLDESLWGLSVSLDHETERQRYSLSASAYEGFRSYTSLWIDEYYRQQYSAGGIPGVSYEDPDPRGHGFSASYSYEILHQSGFLTLSGTYLRDRVAPGYEIEDLGTSFELVRGETVLHTWTGSIEYEGIINRWARTRQTLSLSKTSTRELRLGWTGSVNASLGQQLISRTSASWSSEDPGFEAWSVSQTFEYEFNEEWSLSATARYYEDTGQIETANLISSAAPALKSKQFYVTLRKVFTGSESAVSLSVGPYFSDYAVTGIGTERFINLYSDRDWWWGRLAFRKAF